MRSLLGSYYTHVFTSKSNITVARNKENMLGQAGPISLQELLGNGGDEKSSNPSTLAGEKIKRMLNRIEWCYRTIAVPENGGTSTMEATWDGFSTT